MVDRPDTDVVTDADSPSPDKTRRDYGAMGRLILRVVAPVALASLVVLAWQIAVQVGGLQPTTLPSPTRVAEAAWQNRELLWLNTVPTLKATVIGLVVSMVAAVLIATVLSFVPWLRGATLPLLIAAQAIPIVVLAPLFVIWFGFGLGPKITLIVIATSLPMTIALTEGFLSADPDAAKLMKALGANRPKVFLRLQIPSALPFFFTGLRIVASYAVLAAIFAETAGAERGLGIFMMSQKSSLRTDLVLAAVIISIAMGLVLFSLTYLLEALMMPWERRRKAMRTE
ncbi:ABC transporter permease [Rhodococcus sp. KBW08]|uniref:ABC transporter permease n=1 Tax=Rhodococcus sp. KBW08 TaxID=2144188 RepID=UPI0021AA4515|nr:ABC transporter permease [Rhodococcus sp. KBW08]MDJ0105296.1 ABC transporter permease [Rhodococcus erythropolis]